jgi:hypothetical protein
VSLLVDLNPCGGSKAGQCGLASLFGAIIAVHDASGLRCATGAFVEMAADIFDLVQHSIVLCDRGGRVIRWNAASE